jgi:hypothetical protein
MSEFFFKLDSEERREVIQRAAVQSGMAEDVLEKDIWLVWTLQRLFAIPNVPQMAFKGGTALSKVFGAIDRFSEDVDVSVDYRQLMPELYDANLASMSKSARKKASDNLRGLLTKLSHDVLVPHIEVAADTLMGKGACQIEVDASGEKIRLHYPSVAAKGGYLKDEVLIELGGRNPTEPNQTRVLTTEIARILPVFEWPTAEVAVLNPTRTFWEKATLIHIECSRTEPKFGDRIFRHWYDLSKLAEHEIGSKALVNITLLENVVKHKEAFYAYSKLGYDGCLSGALRLVPGKDLLDVLAGDYRGMIEQRMFSGMPPDFALIIDRIKRLETEINRAVTAFNNRAAI